MEIKKVNIINFVLKLQNLTNKKKCNLIIFHSKLAYVQHKSSMCFFKFTVSVILIGVMIKIVMLYYGCLIIGHLSSKQYNICYNVFIIKENETNKKKKKQYNNNI